MLVCALAQETAQQGSQCSCGCHVGFASFPAPLTTQGLCGEQLVRSLPLSCFCMSWPACVLSMSDPGGSCPCVSRHCSHYGSSFVTSHFKLTSETVLQFLFISDHKGCQNNGEGGKHLFSLDVFRTLQPVNFWSLCFKPSSIVHRWRFLPFTLSKLLQSEWKKLLKFKIQNFCHFLKPKGDHIC